MLKIYYRIDKDYSMRHVKRTTPPFYSLKANFWDFIIFLTELYII